MPALRSFLIVPANREHMLAKAPSYGADALVFDLEDSVPVAQKGKARELAREYIERYQGNSTVHVKVSSLQSGMLGADLDAVAVEGLAGIRLPKADSPDAIRAVDEMLAARERSRRLPVGSIAICPMLESARGVWLAFEILSASTRVRSVIPGMAQDADLQSDLGYETTVGENPVRHYVRCRVLVAARAAGVHQPLDGVYAGVRDVEGLRRECLLARSLGYRGKQVIHPAQIETVNDVFSVSADAVAYYRRIIAAFDDALARGSAATTVDGRLVDYAMVEMAKRVLARAGD